MPKPGEANLANLPGFRPDHSDDEAKMDVDVAATPLPKVN